MCFEGVTNNLYASLCDVRCSSVPPFIPLYPLLHHPPFLSNGQSGIDIISLEDPSLCQSLFIYSMATGLIMVSLPPSLPLTLSLILFTSCLACSPAISLPLYTVSFLLKRIARLHKWFHVKPTPSLPPLIPFRLWHRFTVTD